MSTPTPSGFSVPMIPTPTPVGDAPAFIGTPAEHIPLPRATEPPYLTTYISTTQMIEISKNAVIATNRDNAFNLFIIVCFALVSIQLLRKRIDKRRRASLRAQREQMR